MQSLILQMRRVKLFLSNQILRKYSSFDSKFQVFFFSSDFIELYFQIIAEQVDNFGILNLQKKHSGGQYHAFCVLCFSVQMKDFRTMLKVLKINIHLFQVLCISKRLDLKRQSMLQGSSAKSLVQVLEIAANVLLMCY